MRRRDVDDCPQSAEWIIVIVVMPSVTDTHRLKPHSARLNRVGSVLDPSTMVGWPIRLSCPYLRANYGSGTGGE